MSPVSISIYKIYFMIRHYTFLSRDSEYYQISKDISIFCQNLILIAIDGRVFLPFQICLKEL